jgi:hypothetical protein
MQHKTGNNRHEQNQANIPGNLVGGYVSRIKVKSKCHDGHGLEATGRKGEQVKPMGRSALAD